MIYRIIISFLLLIAIVSCGDSSTEPQYTTEDTLQLQDDHHVPDTVDVFSGGRFRNVRVERVGDSTFRITGEAQVFEAAFSWVVEDGHNELKKGYGTAAAGAPAWGKFEFEVTVAKTDPNSTLHLVLFESSAKDGSRQHELPVRLY